MSRSFLTSIGIAEYLKCKISELISFHLNTIAKHMVSVTISGVPKLLVFMLVLAPLMFVVKLKVSIKFRISFQYSWNFVFSSVNDISKQHFHNRHVTWISIYDNVPDYEVGSPHGLRKKNWPQVNFSIALEWICVMMSQWHPIEARNMPCDQSIPFMHQYNDTSSYAVLYVLCKTSKTLQGIRRVRHRILIKLCTFLSKTLIILELPYTRPVRPVWPFSWQVCSSLDWS